MKTLINTLVISTALLIGANAFAQTDAQQISACKAQVLAEYGEVDRIKVASINSKRKVFKAKLKVSVNGEKNLYNCEIREGSPIVLDCLKGTCGVEKVAAK